MTISGNWSPSNTGGISNDAADITLRNCLIIGNSGDFDLLGTGTFINTSSLIGTAYYDETGTATNPAGVTPESIFVAPIDPMDWPEESEPWPGMVRELAPYGSTNYNLKPGSFAINKGDSLYFSAGQIPDLSGILTDVEGNARIQGSTVDLGSYEFDPANSRVESWMWY